MPHQEYFIQMKSKLNFHTLSTHRHFSVVSWERLGWKEESEDENWVRRQRCAGGRTTSNSQVQLAGLHLQKDPLPSLFLGLPQDRARGRRCC